MHGVLGAESDSRASRQEQLIAPKACTLLPASGVRGRGRPSAPLAVSLALTVCSGISAGGALP